MNELIQRFIDLNIKVEKMSNKEQMIRYKRLMDYIVKESVEKLGNDADYILNSVVTLMSCLLAYNEKYKVEHYNKVNEIAQFANLPVFKDYKLTINSLLPKTQNILKDLFSNMKKRSNVLDEKVIRYTVELLVTLNFDVEVIKLFSSLFKGK